MENPNSDLVLNQPPIISLFQIIRNILIIYLTATDLSMFLAATGTTITPNQKNEFLNPVRDLGEQNDVAKLISAGFGVTIAGVDCYLLMERIAMPVTYCKKYGRRKQLQFIALVQKPTSDLLHSQLLCMCRFRSDNYTCPHTTNLSYRSVLPLQGAVMLMEKSQQRDWRHNQTLNLYNASETWITYGPKQTDHISLTIGCTPVICSCDTMADYMIWQGEVERNFNFSSIVYGKSESGDYFVDIITVTLDPWTIHRVPPLSYHGILAPTQLDNAIRIICRHETSRHNNTHTVSFKRTRKLGLRDYCTVL